MVEFEILPLENPIGCSTSLNLVENPIGLLPVETPILLKFYQIRLSIMTFL